MKIKLRDPNTIMKLSRLGSFHQSRLSFLRSFLSEFQDWKFKRDLFELDKNGEMEYISGAVPDSFNQQGQVWGNALYKWDNHKSSNFKYWKEKLNKSLELYDYLRVDHFVGFFKFWAIPKGESALV